MDEHGLLQKQKEKYEIKIENKEQQEDAAFKVELKQDELAKEKQAPAALPEEQEYQYEKKQGKSARGKKVPNYVLKNKRKKLKQNEKDEKIKLIDDKLSATFAEWDERLEEEDDFSVLKYPVMSDLEKEHEVVKETIVKQHTFKKDEVITRTVVTDKEKKVSDKKAIAKRMKLYTDELDTKKVRARADVSIDDKKLLDYRTFEQLSEFAPLLEKEDSLSKLCSSYGKAKQKYKGNVDAKNEENADKVYREEVCPVLDGLTASIMKMDASSFKIGSDEELAKNASELESMSRALSAYMGILGKEAKYKEYLFSRKVKDGSESWGDKLLKQLDRLSAVSEYYRLRRLVIEDEYYINHANEEIPLQEEKDDPIAVKRLKKNMRASVMAAGNLSRIFRKTGVELPTFKDSDMAGILTKYSYENKETDEKKHRESAERHLLDITSSDQYIRDLEKTRYLQPPFWLQNALTMDPEEIKKKKLNKDAGFVGGSAHTDMPMIMNYIKKTGNQDLYDRIMDMKNKKMKGGPWGESPNFEGGDELLADITISDSWNRSMFAYSSEYNYRRTDDEILEMMDILSIQKDKEKWNEIKKDPQAFAFYESAYKEMLMKNVSIIYSSAKRMSETICGKLLTLHTADLIQQMTAEIRSVIMNTAIISNITEKNNAERLEKLFKENDLDGRYFFDMEGLMDMDALSTANFKLNAVGNAYIDLLMKGSNFIGDEESARKARIKIFGDDDFYTKVIKPEYEANKKQAVKEGFSGSDNKIISWYLIHHPEYMTIEKLNTKVDDVYVFQHDLKNGYSSFYTGAEEKYRNMIKNKKIDLPSEEEMKKYEQSLKDRKLFAMRADAEDDPKPEEDVKIGKTGLTIKWRVISENRKNDPYGLNLVRNGLEELVIKDKDGKTIIRSGQDQL